jgi:hypothetical protein
MAEVGRKISGTIWDSLRLSECGGDILVYSLLIREMQALLSFSTWGEGCNGKGRGMKDTSEHDKATYQFLPLCISSIKQQTYLGACDVNEDLPLISNPSRKPEIVNPLRKPETVNPSRKPEIVNPSRMLDFLNPLKTLDSSDPLTKLEIVSSRRNGCCNP